MKTLILIAVILMIASVSICRAVDERDLVYDYCNGLYRFDKDVDGIQSICFDNTMKAYYEVVEEYSDDHRLDECKKKWKVQGTYNWRMVLMCVQ